MNYFKVLLSFFIVFFPLCLFAQDLPDSVKTKEAPKIKTEGKVENRQITVEELQEALYKALEEKDDVKSGEDIELEIDGLLIDETITKSGHDFYDIFYQNWTVPPKIKNYTIRIIERPVRGRSFQVLVLVNEEEIFENNLQSSFDALESLALAAVHITRDYLMNYENLKQQLETDDQQGTGLF